MTIGSKAGTWEHKEPEAHKSEMIVEVPHLQVAECILAPKALPIAPHAITVRTQSQTKFFRAREGQEEGEN